MLKTLALLEVSSEPARPTYKDRRRPCLCAANSSIEQRPLSSASKSWTIAASHRSSNQRKEKSYLQTNCRLSGSKMLCTVETTWFCHSKNASKFHSFARARHVANFWQSLSTTGTYGWRDLGLTTWCSQILVTTNDFFSTAFTTPTLSYTKLSLTWEGHTRMKERKQLNSSYPCAGSWELSCNDVQRSATVKGSTSSLLAFSASCQKRKLFGPSCK